MICTKCKQDKNLELFRDRKDSASGKQYWCRACEVSAIKKKYVKKPPRPKKILDKNTIKLNALKRMLMHRYSLTYESYLDMYKSQNKKCKICGKEKELGGRNGLQIDHCHVSGKVRHLLCPSCNQGIAFIENFRDVEKIGSYLNIILIKL